MMKIVFDEGECEKTSFPCMMQDDRGLIVIMVEPGKGFAIPGRFYTKGLNSSYWDMSKFKEMPGTVTLSNM